eukprot:3940721-Rhodomonas_salina.4
MEACLINPCGDPCLFQTENLRAAGRRGTAYLTMCWPGRGVREWTGKQRILGLDLGWNRGSVTLFTGTGQFTVLRQFARNCSSLLTFFDVSKLEAISTQSHHAHEMGDAAASQPWTAAQIHAKILSEHKLSLRKLRLTELHHEKHSDQSRGDLPTEFCVVQTAIKLL